MYNKYVKENCSEVDYVTNSQNLHNNNIYTKDLDTGNAANNEAKKYQEKNSLCNKFLRLINRTVFIIRI